MNKHLPLGILVLSLLAGCSPAVTPSTPAPPPANPVKVDGTDYMLTDEPKDATDVIQAREAANDGDEVVIAGRIGGGETPLLTGRAAFSIVDRSLKSCSDMEEHGCPTPWDYCCDSNLANGMALVKFVDDEGSLIRADAREMLGVKELSRVVVKGKARRDDAGNLTVLASGIYVREQ